MEDAHPTTHLFSFVEVFFFLLADQKDWAIGAVLERTLDLARFQVASWNQSQWCVAGEWVCERMGGRVNGGARVFEQGNNAIFFCFVQKGNTQGSPPKQA